MKSIGLKIDIMCKKQEYLDITFYLNDVSCKSYNKANNNLS